MANLSIRRYEKSLHDAWDEFVQQSKNGTFLLERDYMEYDRDRFEDCSLLILNDGRIVALLPANRVGDSVHSHQGLTYGGLVTSELMTTPLMIDVFAALVEYLARAGASHLYYKTIPTIYHQMPAEEDRYALFVLNAELYRRDVLSVLPIGPKIDLQARRRRGASKATMQGVAVFTSDDWPSFWSLLSNHLRGRFGVAPVHTLLEIERLRKRFPANIRLHIARLKEEILAGVVVYESTRVAHVQYVAASPKGRELGALDKLFVHLLSVAYASKAFFDFGISNENDGRILNRGLIEQKEGFGARALVHDFYRLQVQGDS